MVNFPGWLQSELNKRSWSVSELARQAKVSQASISLILSESRNPGPDICNAIARAFTIPPETVFREAGLLPPVSETETWISEVVHIMGLLDEDDKSEMLEYARHRLVMADKKGRYKVDVDTQPRPKKVER
jgi:transcriptional regulator with XRE-family HTH domain